jgi:hypothetical protein
MPINYNELRQSILQLRKLKAPMVIVEAQGDDLALTLELMVLDICDDISLQVISTRSEGRIQFRNLFFSLN